MLFIALWEPAGEGARAANMEWADLGWQTLRIARLARGAYSVDINHMRRPESTELEVALAFSWNLPRLQALKREVDPGCLFRASWPLLPMGEMRRRFGPAWPLVAA